VHDGTWRLVQQHRQLALDAAYPVCQALVRQDDLPRM